MYNSEFVLTHFKRYNPSFAPDLMYSDLRSRVCALKNLTRCFGLISLIENGIFSRNIDECLILAKVKDKKYLLSYYECFILTKTNFGYSMQFGS